MLCDVVQDGVNFAKCLVPSGHFGIQILTNKIHFLGRSEPVYNTLRKGYSHACKRALN